jgi:hypothetical protein
LRGGAPLRDVRQLVLVLVVVLVVMTVMVVPVVMRLLVVVHTATLARSPYDAPL